MTLHPIPLNFLIYEENFILFLSVRSASIDRPESRFVRTFSIGIKIRLRAQEVRRAGWTW